MYPYGQGQPPNPLYSQPTGQGQPLYGQPTGQPTGQLNGQPTGQVPYSAYGAAAQPQQLAPMTTGYPQQMQYQQPMATSYQQMQPQVQSQVQPQQVLASNATTSTSNSSGNAKLKIPNVRLSFITADDQEKFEQLFRSAVAPHEQALSGDRAKQILMRSNLSANTLGDIWQLADTTKSGTLMFPEFALAMYLCSLAIRGQGIPATLPEKIKNEVSSLVDIISFSFDDSAANSSQTSLPSNVPDFRSSQTQIQSQPTGYQQPLQAQRTGGGSIGSLQSLQTLQPQATGYQQPQPTGGYQQPLQAQRTGGGSIGSLQSLQTLQPQATGYQQPQTTGYQQPQATGYQQPQATGYQQPQATGYQQPLQSQATGITPLSAMPTGKPGQWGFINTPQQGLPGIEALRSQLMPQKTGAPSVNIPQSQLQGNARVEWAITKDEKQVYDSIFNAWDKTRQGFITGDVAIEVFGKSGLNREDLAKIWALADPDDRGRLSKDEFAVAMHLIYRTLNNHPLPSELPAELVPPSQRRLSESVSQIKSYLRANPTGSSASRLQNDRGSGNNLNNWRSTTAANSNKDAAVFKNNDDEMGAYVSSARHRSRKPRDGSTSGEEQQSSFQKDPEKMTIAELQKAIREKKILLDAIDAQDEEDYSAVQDMESKNSAAIDDLKRTITNVQKEISKYPDSAVISSDQNVDKRTTLRRLHAQTDLVPQLVSSIKSHDDEIVAARLELFRLEYERDHPGATIAGTGPNGQITDVDRRRARSKAILRRANALTRGGTAPSTADSDIEAFESAYAQERSKYASERDSELRMFTEIEESINQLQSDLERGLKETPDDVHSDRERRRWEEAIGVEDDTKDFIYSLRRLVSDRPKTNGSAVGTSSGIASSSGGAPSSVSSSSNNANVATGGSGVSTAGMTPAQRAAHIKAEADRKMTERLAALGITRKPKGTSNAFQPPSSTPEPKTESKPEPQPAEPRSQPKSVEPNPVEPAESDSSDDDDTEEQELLKARAEQEARLKKLEEDAKARKAKDAAKKQQKEKRRQELLAEIEAAKERERQLLEQGEESSGDDEPSAKPSEPKPQEKAPEPEQASGVDTNPFLRDNNPFFKPQQSSAVPAAVQPATAPAVPSSAWSAKETIDPVEAAKQRQKQQGGNASDDEWGDGGGFVSEDSSDDENSTRGNPVALASRLFGSIGASRSAGSSTATVDKKEPAKSTSTVSTPAAVPPAAPPAAPPVAPPVPTPTFNEPQSVDTDSDNDSAFATPSSGSPVRNAQPTLSTFESTGAPSIPPPPPPPSFTNGSTAVQAPSGPPPLPPVQVANGAPPGAPPPPPPPPVNGNGGAPAPPAAGPPGLPDTSGLFADIMKGKSLKKVAAPSESSSLDLGRVL